jgi:diketogulonate reductase-like aldo/keto reductase
MEREPPVSTITAEIPSFLYGTAWKEERSEALTSQALTLGFRGIDTANQRKHYFEVGVAKAVLGAIATGSVTRAQLFLQSKFTFQDGQDHRLPYDANAPVASQVAQSFQSSLEHFETDYLDSYLLHGPSTRGKLAAADIEAWRAIEALARDGRARFIGVSNFSAAQLEELVGLSSVPPKFVQNRCYARTGWDRDVRALCARHGIVYQGFSLLTANRKELESKTMLALGARLQRKPAELVFAFARQVGMLPLTGSSNAEHLRLDLGALQLSLSRADQDSIERIAG